MKNTKTIASDMFRNLVGTLRWKLSIKDISIVINRSPRTVYQYCVNPDSTAFRLPPVEITDRMVDLVMLNDVITPSEFSYRIYGHGKGYRVGQNKVLSYLVALDMSDARKQPIAVTESMGSTPPQLSNAEQLRHKWRKVFFSGKLLRQELADIAGTDIYNVAWVGREHPTRGIQPTHEMVMYATATDAAWAMQEVAA